MGRSSSPLNVFWDVFWAQWCPRPARHLSKFSPVNCDAAVRWPPTSYRCTVVSSDRDFVATSRWLPNLYIRLCDGRPSGSKLLRNSVEKIKIELHKKKNINITYQNNVKFESVLAFDIDRFSGSFAKI